MQYYVAEKKLDRLIKHNIRSQKKLDKQKKNWTYWTDLRDLKREFRNIEKPSERDNLKSQLPVNIRWFTTTELQGKKLKFLK